LTVLQVGVGAAAILWKISAAASKTVLRFFAIDLQVLYFYEVVKNPLSGIIV
jgi:hypothetical protein